MPESEGRKRLWFLLLPTLLIAVGLFQLRGCGFWPKLSTLWVKTDPAKPLIVKPGRVIYTPSATEEDPDPTPVELWKPLESVPVLGTDGVLKIPFSGFTLIPKAGATYVLNQGLQAYGSARVFFAGARDGGHPERDGFNFGIEVGANIHNGFLGVDLRDPLLNLLTTSLGAAFPWGSPGSVTLYLGQSATLAL